jgi:hypothetical protein
MNFTKTEAAFWALAGPTFEHADTYFGDQRQRMDDRPAPRYALGDLVTASRAPQRKGEVNKRPEAGQVCGIDFLATMGIYKYAVSFAADSWCPGREPYESQLDQDWHQAVIDRRRKHYVGEHAPRFQSQLAAFLTETPPKFTVGDEAMWTVPRHKQTSRRHPLPPQIPVMTCGATCRSDVRWDDGPAGSQSVLRFELKWDYHVLPKVGICHYTEHDGSRLQALKG